MAEHVDIPPELVWDYSSPPDDLMWRLQRIAEWFPAFGRDPHTVALLYQRREALKVPPEIRELIELYEEARVAAEEGRGRRK
jgi:hypothetical protein